MVESYLRPLAEGGFAVLSIDPWQTRTEVDRNRIAAIGERMGGLLALYAAALDERIQAVAAATALVSCRSAIQTEIYAHRFSAFAPRLLRDFDLPDLAALIAPRPLLLVNPTDPLHRRVPLEQADETYRGARQVFRLLGAEGHFSLAQADSAGEIVGRYFKHLTR